MIITRSQYMVLLKNRDFASLWAAQFVSQLGDAIFNLAIAWIILTMTDSAVVMASAMLVIQTSYLAAFVFAGPIVDRFNRRNIMITADLVRGVVISILALFIIRDTLETRHIYAFCAIDGVMTALFSSAKMAVTPMLVKNEELIPANALNSASSHITGILGPALGGLLISLPAFGAAGATLINAASFIVGTIGLLAMRNTNFTPAGRKEAGESLMAELASGVRYAYSRPALLRLSLFLAAFNFIAAPVFVLLPLFAKNTLTADPVGLGMLEGSLFAGALAGAAVIGFIGERYRRGRRMMVFYIFQGLVMTLFSLTRDLRGALAVLFLYGIVSVAAKSLLTSHIQLKVENEFRGRVFSFLYLVSDGLVPVSIALTGVLADRFGLVTVMTAAGICAIAVAALGLLAVPVMEIEK